MSGTVSAKAIFLHEKEYDSPVEFTVPHGGTVRVYAEVFRLQDDSAEFQAFLAAVDETKRRRKEARQAAPENVVVDPSLWPLPPIGPSTFSSRFVMQGREAQWDRQRRELDAMLDGRPRVAFLQGEAGIGKPRLLRELARHVEHGNARALPWVVPVLHAGAGEWGRAAVAVTGQCMHRYQFAHALYQEYLVGALGQIRREQHLAGGHRTCARSGRG